MGKVRCEIINGELTKVQCDRDVTRVVIPEGVKIIGSNAFLGCISLQEIQFPGSLRVIKRDAFGDVRQLNRILISESVEEIWPPIFDFCRNLQEIHLLPGKTLSRSLIPECRTMGASLSVSQNSRLLKAEDYLILSRDGKILYHCDVDTKGTVRVLDGVETVARNAFEHCNQVTRIFFPDSLRSIENAAMRNCSRLREVRLPEKMCSLGGDTFQDCHALRSIILPEGISLLPDGTFKNCEGLQGVQLPSTLKIVGYAFSGCRSLEELVLDWYPFQQLEPERKWNVALGVLRRLKTGEKIGEETLRDACSWIRENVERVWEIQDLRIPLLQAGLISADAYDGILNSTLKEEKRDPEVIAMLLEYPERFFTPEEREKRMTERFAL